MLEAGTVSETCPPLGVRSASCTNFCVPVVSYTCRELALIPAGMVIVVDWLAVFILTNTIVRRLSPVLLNAATFSPLYVSSSLAPPMEALPFSKVALIIFAPGRIQRENCLKASYLKLFVGLLMSARLTTPEESPAL
jgi:hypothetical protein